MADANSTFIATPISAAVTAVLTIAQAVPAIDKRLARVSEVETQIGRMPALVTRSYVWMQRLYKGCLICVTAVGITMVLAFVLQDTFRDPVSVWLRSHGLALLIVWLAVGFAMYTNFFSWLIIGTRWLARATSNEPLGWDLAWHALRSFVDLNENAKPLVVNERAAIGFADTIVGWLKTETAATNRASPPPVPAGVDARLFRQRLGNGLLIGCVIEGAHGDLRLGRREWQPFYDAIGGLASESDLLSPTTINARHADARYYESICDELNQLLVAHGEQRIADSAELKHRLRTTLTVLADKYAGDATTVNSAAAWSNDRSADASIKRAGVFPALASEGIRVQFVKLAAVWGVWPDVPLSTFHFPFAKRIAAVLLDRGVILAPGDVKVLAFDHPRERRVEQAAEGLVIRHAIRLVEDDRSKHEKWLPVASLGTSGEAFRWWVAYELDYRLWDYAKRAHDAAGLSNILSSWQQSGPQVVRISKRS
jgi:hypothetical protein